MQNTIFVCNVFCGRKGKHFILYLNQGIRLKFVNTAVWPDKPIFHEANYI